MGLLSKKRSQCANVFEDRGCDTPKKNFGLQPDKLLHLLCILRKRRKFHKISPKYHGKTRRKGEGTRTGSGRICGKGAMRQATEARRLAMSFASRRSIAKASAAHSGQYPWLTSSLIAKCSAGARQFCPIRIFLQTQHCTIIYFHLVRWPFFLCDSAWL